MKERPILFSGPMVRAILEGRKTQTRRVVSEKQFIGYPAHEIRFGCHEYFTTMGGLSFGWKCPYGDSGDRLWVRETSIITPKHWDDMRTFTCLDSDGDKRWVQYLATSPNRDAASDYALKTTPSIYMPRWASRITLEITDLRVQRVQEISFEDILAEGILGWVDSFGRENMKSIRPNDPFAEPDTKTWPGSIDEAANDLEIEMRYCFACLWDHINAKRGFGWDANPWVWTVTFRRMQL